MGNRDRISRPRLAVLSLAACLVLAGCSSAASTPVVVFVTPAPTITAAPTDTPVATATATPTAAATDTPVATATATPTATPAPAASPTSAAAACTGNASNKAFFVEAASKEPFDVYCAVLPSTWWLEEGEYTLPNGGKVAASYKNAAGSLLRIVEGAYCTTSPAACSPHVSVIGPASFGGLAGTLDTLTSDPVWVIYVAPGTTHAYAFMGIGMSQAQFKAWAAAIRKVPAP